MKTEKEIREFIAKIDNDERYHYKIATIAENAPLALIQFGMEIRVKTLAWVLEEEPPKLGPKIKEIK